jgi:cytochrome P450
MQVFAPMTDPISVLEAPKDPQGPAHFWPRALAQWKKETFTQPKAGRSVSLHIEGPEPTTAGLENRVLVAFGHPLVTAVLGNARDFSSAVVHPKAGRPLSPVSGIQTRTFIFKDGKQAHSQRIVVAKDIRSARMAREDRRNIVETRADQALDALSPERAVDLVDGVTVPYTYQVIADVFGIPDDIRREMQSHMAIVATAVANPFDEQLRRDAHPHATALVSILDRFIDTNTPHAPMMQALIDATGEGKPYPTREDQLAGMVLALAAGHLTTANFIANAVVGLTREHRDQFSTLTAGFKDGEVMDSALEELLRYYGPVQFISREVVRPVEIDGIRVEAGEFIWLAAGASGFDADVIPHPEVLALDRYLESGRVRLGESAKGNPFGFGPHFCIGTALAKMEADVFFRQTYERLGGLKIVDYGNPCEDDFTISGRKGILVQAPSKRDARFLWSGAPEGPEGRTQQLAVN